MEKLILMVLLALVSTTAWGDWAIKGEGNFNCPTYVSERQINGAKLYSSISWVQGFISGMNYQRALGEDSHSLLGQDLPAAAMVSWLENYCRANPQDYLADAAEALVRELKEKAHPEE